MDGYIDEIIKHSANACSRINNFSQDVLKTRGGRIGSGMGLLIEALWGYYMNIELTDQPIEIGWFPDHQYNDFVCLKKGEDWVPETGQGEVCRIEVKSMNSGADESKAHFDVLQKEIDPIDLLLVITWEWKKLDDHHFFPYINDHFIGLAHDIIKLRDSLHITRGGIFTDHTNCEEDCNCDIDECLYYGEPLNSSSKRERITGPPKTRPSEKVAYAANFGGLLRMIKTSSEDSRNKFREIRKSNLTAHNYISFIHRNFAAEELNQFTKEEWLVVAKSYEVNFDNSLSKQEIYTIVKSNPDYQERLKNLL
ncbi:hypothetical protein E0I26_06425 [Flavobacterium rhamnosiphilum]|uniref:Restriction endonuclease n=1 Tax=Flavobacterium rhamnosiphilum TaxID=2541724 RepID=A0A4R5FBB3_9FLAO|nr:hypothetical protein [Flavobacterium rhamnosiphilum]TDE45579.1 hypothetical protein E0I26_06425 [Flavobacterium rhamnosiphilum]